jgi:hypothetical protein
MFKFVTDFNDWVYEKVKCPCTFCTDNNQLMIRTCLWIFWVSMAVSWVELLLVLLIVALRWLGIQC